MSVMTPRGLKIRFEPEHVFTLISRIMEKDRRHDAFNILMTVEAIQSFESFCGWFAGVIVIIGTSGRHSWVAIAGAMVVGRLFGQMMVWRFTWPAPLLLPVLRYTWVYASGYGVLFIAGNAAGYWWHGWSGVAGWWLGTIAGAIMGQLIELLMARRHFVRYGFPTTPSEAAFIGGFFLHANRVGVDDNLKPDDAEAMAETWKTSFVDYFVKYPESVRRMPNAAQLIERCAPEIQTAMAVKWITSAKSAE